MDFEQQQVIRHIKGILYMPKEEAKEYFRNNILNCIGEITQKRERDGYNENYETQQWNQYHGIANRVWKVIHRMI